MSLEEQLEAVEAARKDVELAQMELDTTLHVRTAGTILGALSVVSFGSIAVWNTVGMTGFNGAAIPIGIVSFIGALIALVSVYRRLSEEFADTTGYGGTTRHVTRYEKPKIVAARLKLAEAQKTLRVKQGLLTQGL